MLNIRLPELNDYQDVMTHNNARLLSKFMSGKKLLKTVQESSRENARTPMQWSDEPNAGFSTAKPWFFVNDNYRQINVRAQEDDPDSLLNFYRALIKFRKEQPVVLYGEYREHMPKSKDFYVYEREYRGTRLLVICSFSSELKRFDAPEWLDLSKGTLALCNYDRNFVIANGFTARPYELRVYLFEH